MGGKRGRKGLRLFVSLAGMIPLLLAGACAPRSHGPEARLSCPEQTPCVCGKHDRLAGLSRYLSRGDFEGAVAANQRLLSRSPKTPPGDEALMNLGLISAHEKNPRRDYKRALGYFMRVEREFPHSPLAEEANIWASVLRAFEKTKQVDLEIEEKKKELGNER